MVGPKRDKQTDEWKKLHNMELRYLYENADIIRIDCNGQDMLHGWKTEEEHTSFF